MAIVDNIKIAARLSSTNTSLDDRIDQLVEWAQAELERVGVPESVVTAYEDYPLVQQAIITGACSELLRDSDLQASVAESWEYQKDALRKHKWGD